MGQVHGRRIIKEKGVKETGNTAGKEQEESVGCSDLRGEK